MAQLKYLSGFGINEKQRYPPPKPFRVSNVPLDRNGRPVEMSAVWGDGTGLPTIEQLLTAQNQPAWVVGPMEGNPAQEALFALKDLDKGQIVGIFTGQQLRFDSSDLGSNDFTDGHAKWAINMQTRASQKGTALSPLLVGNAARFMNDFHGRSESPNVELCGVTVMDSAGFKTDIVYVRTTANVACQSELLASYNNSDQSRWIGARWQASNPGHTVCAN